MDFYYLSKEFYHNKYIRYNTVNKAFKEFNDQEISDFNYQILCIKTLLQHKTILYFAGDNQKPGRYLFSTAAYVLTVQ